jgi:hypothetical protein
MYSRFGSRMLVGFRLHLIRPPVAKNTGRPDLQKGERYTTSEECLETFEANVD